ncbi:MAG: hypothetical protein ABWW69_03295 [Pyrodictiaceae archaeon]
MGKLINNATEASRGNVIIPFQRKMLEEPFVAAITSFWEGGYCST